MDTDNYHYAFTETRLNLEASSSTFVVNIKVPEPANSRGSYRRHNADGKEIDEENVFALTILAQSSSIFQRRFHTSPKSFLWRVLEDGLTLSVRAVDVFRQDLSPEAPYILNFHFHVPIQPSCVALAEPEKSDALCIFVIDQAGSLYSFTLHTDNFRRRASDSSVKDGCSVSNPQSLSSGQPLRLVAVSENRILVTLRDGGLVRLDRNTTGDCTALFFPESLRKRADKLYSSESPVAADKLSVYDVVAKPSKRDTRIWRDYGQIWQAERGRQCSDISPDISWRAKNAIFSLHRLCRSPVASVEH
jgi:nuclear pore complex protein Nup160